MNRLRKISVDDRVYLWQRKHIHLPHYIQSPCVEQITIYREGKKKSPLRLSFKEDDNLTIPALQWHLYGAGSGVIWRNSTGRETDGRLINCNRPQVIKDIIRYFLKHGWNPESDVRPLEIPDGLHFLEKMELTAEQPNEFNDKNKL